MIQREGRSVEVEWHLFEATAGNGTTGSIKSAFDPQKDCRFLALTAVPEVGSGDGFPYWHMRYGSAGLEALTAESSSLRLPTLCASDMSVADIVARQRARTQELAEMLPRPLTEWHGEWISEAMLCRTPPMVSACVKIAEEAVKLGKDYTTEKVQAYYQARCDTPFLSVVITDGLTVKFRKKDGTFVTAAYADGGAASGGWQTWLALRTDEGTPGYRAVVTTPPVIVQGKEKEGKRWKMRYSNDKTTRELTEISDWTPTFYDPARMTPEIYSDILVKDAVNKAKELP